MKQVLLQKMNDSDQYDRLRTGAGFLRMKEAFTGKKAYISGRFATAILSAVVFVFAFFAIGSAVIPEVKADPDVVRICIDPGHGGENLGADYNGYLEKDMTLIVAEAMREELAKYEGIEVFMTRTSDVDMSLEERVDYAAEVGADFFFCLHFNMSADHDMYGAECWVSAFDSKYSRGMDFAKIEMRALTGLGLYDRGIKTRLNSKGTNYYGVLRMADEVDMPGIIIEHCHLDNYNDEEFYDHHDMLVKYGNRMTRILSLSRSFTVNRMSRRAAHGQTSRSKHTTMTAGCCIIRIRQMEGSTGPSDTGGWMMRENLSAMPS